MTQEGLVYIVALVSLGVGMLVLPISYAIKDAISHRLYLRRTERENQEIAAAYRDYYKDR